MLLGVRRALADLVTPTPGWGVRPWLRRTFVALVSLYALSHLPADLALAWAEGDEPTKEARPVDDAQMPRAKVGVTWTSSDP